MYLLAAAILVFWQQGLDPALDRALAAHKAGRLDDAVREYRTYLKTKPASLEARANLGAVLAAQGQFESAIVEYQTALKSSPSNPAVGFNLALAYYKTGELTRAAKELAAVHALVGDQPQVNLLLADTYLQLNENDKVVRLLTPLAEQNPKDLAVAYLLGSALMRNNKLYEGQKYLDLILRNGDSAEARLLMGTAKMSVNDFSGALAEFQKAVDLNPKLPSVQSVYGQALMATGDSAGAVKAFEAELSQNPNDFTSNLNLAVLRKQDQQFDAAMPLLDRALRIRPGDLGVRYQQAAILVQQNKIDAARAKLEAILLEAPKFTEAHVSLATVYYRLKRKEDGDRERAIVQKLNAEQQEKQPKGEVTRQ